MSQYELWHNVQQCSNMTPWFYIAAGTFMVLVANMASLTGRDATRFLGKNSLEEASDETFDVRRLRGDANYRHGPSKRFFGGLYLPCKKHMFAQHDL